MKRREFMKITGAGLSSLAVNPSFGFSSVKMTNQNQTLEIDPTPKFQLSPWLYMQFMEPLGVTDSSVEAAWDHGSDRWRKDCNNPSNKLRKQNGHPEPHPIKLWQIGNETSYSSERFDVDTTAQKTAVFSKAMKGVDAFACSRI